MNIQISDLEEKILLALEFKGAPLSRVTLSDVLPASYYKVDLAIKSLVYRHIIQTVTAENNSVKGGGKCYILTKKGHMVLVRLHGNYEWSSDDVPMTIFRKFMSLTIPRVDEYGTVRKLY